MYPLLRAALALARASRAAPLPMGAAHVSRHVASPLDIDPVWEVNHGRTLTLFDLGRLPLFIRTGLWRETRARGWGITAAGVSVRYRRRIRVFDRITMVTRFEARDARFFYLTQGFLRGEEATTQALYRLAVTRGARGIVPTDDVLAMIGQPDWQPAIPPWIAAWAEAEALRPWPPAGP